ncbi:lipocalin-like domain-containing protein [Parasedimentitalea psychrophila]|uniref:Lipocalin-like domain-containing protein n=1 Tax=Parasedimentitalea psychrophila TaxID=2997337 RepID=A0A9Y2KY35_9RHOB|nr:lipocalin-like domain-containing protein [Parasedimentitalea psychrophila]WIY24653.1 lipocalin-like domain-containing protein [Parasedimentitalea psychrophila]
MNVRLVIAGVIICLPHMGATQGFAGLGTQVEGFAIPDRQNTLEFPLDHGSHPNFRIEWWYMTANLNGDDGGEYGVQWTLFRIARGPGDRAGWSSPQIWVGHAGLTTEDAMYYDERWARGGIGQAGVSIQPFTAWIDNWAMASPDQTLQNLTVTASGGRFAYNLAMTARGPLVRHGDNGYSVKSAGGQASHYYSQPRYDVTGTLTLADGSVEVTGQGWLDREWSSQPLAKDQNGWDWFSLSFDSGAKLMGFILRGDSGDYSSGTWIDAEGSATPLAPGAFQAVPLDYSIVEGRTVPVTWQVNLPEHEVSVMIQPINEQSWMGTSVPYWEGPVTISGSHTGRGYLEMTGYE